MKPSTGSHLCDGARPRGRTRRTAGQSSLNTTSANDIARGRRTIKSFTCLIFTLLFFNDSKQPLHSMVRIPAQCVSIPISTIILPTYRALSSVSTHLPETNTSHFSLYLLIYVDSVGQQGRNGWPCIRCSHGYNGAGSYHFAPRRSGKVYLFFQEGAARFDCNCMAIRHLGRKSDTRSSFGKGEWGGWFKPCTKHTTRYTTIPLRPL